MLIGDITMAMIENLQNVISNYVKPNFDRTLNFVETRVDGLRNTLIPNTDTPNLFQSALQTLESAAASNKSMFKVVLAGSIGFGAYWLKEKIPSVPAYLFIGAAAGYAFHENFSEICDEVRQKYYNTTPLKFAFSALSTLATAYGTYALLRKFSITETAGRVLATAAATTTALEILRRFGRVSTPQQLSFSDSQTLLTTASDGVSALFDDGE
jgi:hypothetical protein